MTSRLQLKIRKLTKIKCRVENKTTPNPLTKLVGLTLIVGILFVTNPLVAQTQKDSLDIRDTAKDFIEGWYDADHKRFERSLHPEMISKVVTSRDNKSRIQNLSALRLVQLTRNGGGQSVSSKDRIMDIKILDIYKNAATIKILTFDGMEYVHMSKWFGNWKIINILFERK